MQKNYWIHLFISMQHLLCTIFYLIPLLIQCVTFIIQGKMHFLYSINLPLKLKYGIVYNIYYTRSKHKFMLDNIIKVEYNIYYTK